MTKRILYILLFFVSFNAFAQGRHSEKIKAMKVGFITEKLNLTETEAQKFWPIYNAYDEKVTKLKHEDSRKLRSELRNDFDSMTEARASEIVEEFISIEKQISEERQLLVEKLKGVIPAKKIILLIKAEDDFKEMLWKKLKERRGKMKRNIP